tara:strand:- start:7154 stop:7903 length:750 start_codon:yes stop_codon:yes gene_type:complete
MGLWYNCGNGYVKISLARERNNCSAFICCPGPSLSSINPTYLNGHNRIVFSLNNSYPFVRPDIWVGMDEPNGYSSDLYTQPFMKIMRGPHCDLTSRGKQINQNWNLFYANVEKPKDQLDIFLLRKNDINFVWNGNTFATALHIAMWMGCKEFFLFGCDLDNSEKDYFNKIKLKEKQKSYSQRLYNELFNWLKWFNENCNQFGVSIYSCSKNSRINDFLTYVDYLDAIKSCEEKVNLNQPIIRHEEAEDV